MFRIVAYVCTLDVWFQERWWISRVQHPYIQKYKHPKQFTIQMFDALKSKINLYAKHDLLDKTHAFGTKHPNIHGHITIRFLRMLMPFLIFDGKYRWFREVGVTQKYQKLKCMHVCLVPKACVLSSKSCFAYKLILLFKASNIWIVNCFGCLYFCMYGCWTLDIHHRSWNQTSKVQTYATIRNIYSTNIHNNSKPPKYKHT
jgi:hypothetical protein